MTTGTSLSAGNRVELMLNGDGTYERLWADLRSARQSITLQLYYGAPGQMADTLSRILVERAKAGVRVLPTLITADQLELLDDRFQAKTVAELFGYGRGFGLPSPADCVEVRRIMTL